MVFFTRQLLKQQLLVLDLAEPLQRELPAVMVEQ
jgi:hypothetical protein